MKIINEEVDTSSVKIAVKMVREKEASGELKLHGIWFHIREAEVYYLEKSPGGFVLIDDSEGERILSGLGD